MSMIIHGNHSIPEFRKKKKKQTKKRDLKSSNILESVSYILQTFSKFVPFNALKHNEEKHEKK